MGNGDRIERRVLSLARRGFEFDIGMTHNNIL
jgi:hypothetical protein